MSLQSATKWDSLMIIRRRNVFGNDCTSKCQQRIHVCSRHTPTGKSKNLCCIKQHSLSFSSCLSVSLPAWLFVYLLFYYHRVSLIQTGWDRRVSRLVIF